MGAEAVNGGWGGEEVFRDSREECPREGRQSDRGACAFNDPALALALLLSSLSSILLASAPPPPPAFPSEPLVLAKVLKAKPRPPNLLRDPKTLVYVLGTHLPIAEQCRHCSSECARRCTQVGGAPAQGKGPLPQEPT